MVVSRPFTPRPCARTMASAARQRISASGRSRTFTQRSLAFSGKTKTVRGPGVSGALYIGESMTLSKAGISSGNEPRSRGAKEWRSRGESHATTEHLNLVHIVQPSGSGALLSPLLPYSFAPPLLGSSLRPIQLPHAHGEEQKQDHAGGADDPPVGGHQLVLGEPPHPGGLQRRGHWVDGQGRLDGGVSERGLARQPDHQGAAADGQQRQVRGRRRRGG